MFIANIKTTLYRRIWFVILFIPFSIITLLYGAVVGWIDGIWLEYKFLWPEAHSKWLKDNE